MVIHWIVILTARKMESCALARPRMVVCSVIRKESECPRICKANLFWHNLHC